MAMAIFPPKRPARRHREIRNTTGTLPHERLAIHRAKRPRVSLAWKGGRLGVLIDRFEHFVPRIVELDKPVDQLVVRKPGQGRRNSG